MKVEICILAGGLSSRMGRDKSRVRIGRRTLLGHIRAIARQLDLPIRVLRRDAVPRCGPIGGIYTALAHSRADATLFLACDMPFITPAFLKQMLKTITKKPQSRTSSLPLPKGEGWGEGERPQSKSQPPSVSQISALFASQKNLIGLPCILHRETALPIVTRQIGKSRFSLQSLAKALHAKTLQPARQPAQQLLNINTPADLQSACGKLVSPKVNV